MKEKIKSKQFIVLNIIMALILCVVVLLMTQTSFNIGVNYSIHVYAIDTGDLGDSTGSYEDDEWSIDKFRYNNEDVCVIGAYLGSDTIVSVPEYIDGAKVVGLDDTFNGCDEIVSVTLPGTIEFLGYSVFAYCASLEYVCINSDNIYMAVTGVFTASPNLTAIYVPDDRVDYYKRTGVEKANENWAPYASLIKSVTEMPGYVPQEQGGGANTGVVADIVLPSVAICTLVSIMIVFVVNSKKKSKI